MGVFMRGQHHVGSASERLQEDDHHGLRPPVVHQQSKALVEPGAILLPDNHHNTRCGARPQMGVGGGKIPLVRLPAVPI